MKRPFSNTLLCYPAEIDQPKVSGTAHPDSSDDSSNITKGPAIDSEKGDWDVMEIPIKRTYHREGDSNDGQPIVSLGNWLFVDK
jgi:hypothetical protein